MRFRMAGIALAACTAALGLIVPNAFGAVGCGDVLTHDVKLHADLDCSGYPDNALAIGHNGVTIDLNGHNLTGQPSSDYGISDLGYDGLTVKDGTITGAYESIALTDSDNVTLNRLQLNLEGANEHYGVYAGDLKHLHMSHVNVDNPDYAYYVYDSMDVRLSHSKVTGSDPAISSGVYWGSNSGRYSGTIKDVHTNNAYYAFYLYGATKHLKITDSTANDAGYAGFYIANNFSPRNYTLSDNTANGTADYGFFADKQTSGSGNSAKHHSVKNCVKVHCG